MTDASVEKITLAVWEFDEHLEVNLGLIGEKQADLHISAPNSPGIFELRAVRKE